MARASLIVLRDVVPIVLSLIHRAIFPVSWNIVVFEPAPSRSRLPSFY